MIRAVYFFKDKNYDEIVTFCKSCAKQYGNDLMEIDRAGDWDMCSNCEAQNVPSWYTHNSDFPPKITV